MKAEKQTSAEMVELREVQLRTLREKLQSFQILLAKQVVTSTQKGKLLKGENVFEEQNLHYAGVSSQVKKINSTYCARESAECCPFADHDKLQ